MSTQDTGQDVTVATDTRPQMVGDAGSSSDTGSASAARQMRRSLISDEYIDQLVDQASADGVALTGQGGFLPELIRSVLERGLQTEMSDHVGYEKGDPAGRGSGNSRNGSTRKTLQTEAGPIDLDTPRDRNGSFEPQLVAKGQRRAGGLDEMIISLGVPPCT